LSILPSRLVQISWDEPGKDVTQRTLCKLKATEKRTEDPPWIYGNT